MKDEPIRVEGNKLFCDACRQNISYENARARIFKNTHGKLNVEWEVRSKRDRTKVRVLDKVMEREYIQGSTLLQETKD
jgi:hypothetical protein